MELARLITRYADRFAALGGEGTHEIGSPLGAWLVLALVGPLAEGTTRHDLEDALGTDVDSAREALAGLLAHPHPAVATALAAWQDDFPELQEWIENLPAAVQAGRVPTQDAADAWAREHTFGLIDEFPLGVGDALIMLASALATRVTWLTAFHAVDATELRGPWGDRLTRVLRTPRAEHTGHRAFICRTARGGVVAVHTARAHDELEVTSVIAEAGVARADVLAGAHEIVTGEPEQVSLFDLPLGETAIWSITERDAPRRGEDGAAVLPAWHAASKHDLLGDPELGFDAAGDALAAKVPGPVEARQSAVAAYSRTGFEAAAVTSIGVRLSATVAEPGRRRAAVLNFGHPYAVVATASAADDPWKNLPVFAAWVTEPHDADSG